MNINFLPVPDNQICRLSAETLSPQGYYGFTKCSHDLSNTIESQRKHCICKSSPLILILWRMAKRTSTKPRCQVSEHKVNEIIVKNKNKTEKLAKQETAEKPGNKRKKYGVNPSNLTAIYLSFICVFFPNDCQVFFVIWFICLANDIKFMGKT